MKGHNRLDFFKVINIILILVGCIGFILPFIILSKTDNAENMSTTVPIASIIGYCRFLAAEKNQMFFDIAIHNIAIAILGVIISFFSRGILGCFILFFNLFILGTVFWGTQRALSIVFISLEFIGICLAVFGGTKLSEKRKDGLSLIKLFKSSVILILIITIIYFIAAIIESKIILNQWG